MFLSINKGFDELGRYTNKGNRQFTNFKVSEIKAYRICSTGRKVEIYIDGFNWILTQFDTVLEFEEVLEGLQK